MLIHLTSQQMNMPYIVFSALKDISSFSELTFEYDPCSSDFDIKRKKGKKRQGKIPGTIVCKCGEESCRKWVRVLT